MMRYENPILRGFYPDPSVCRVGDTFYMVCSSFQYFPGVPLFKSKDLINWKQIGHCLTRKSQLSLEGVESSGGVFAPTIRYHNGRFYMVTTNNTTSENFYVYTDDIDGEWSEPVVVKQQGIDPSLAFIDDVVYFTSNGIDEDGKAGIFQSEIDITTGEIKSAIKCIWYGTGGRYPEAPHLYKIKEYYYLILAEGGTEYGHMVTVGRSKSPYGPFESYENNPVLTNRNMGGYEIQGTGHGELVEDRDGNWWLFHLGFRQIGKWTQFHHLGREVFLVPIEWHKDGWFSANTVGVTHKYIETPNISDATKQKLIVHQSFDNLRWDLDWVYLRNPNLANYEVVQTSKSLKLKADKLTLNDGTSPTFIGIRQKEFKGTIVTQLVTPGQTEGYEAGVTLYMDENHHYDLAIVTQDQVNYIVLRVCIGNLKVITSQYPIGNQLSVRLEVVASNEAYSFGYIDKQDERHTLGTAQTKYLSSEVAGGFTGTIIGLYATTNDQEVIDGWTVFNEFNVSYTGITENE